VIASDGGTKTKDWRSSWARRAQIAAIAGLGYPLINALGHTLRWRTEGLHHTTPSSPAAASQ